MKNAFTLLELLSVIIIISIIALITTPIIINVIKDARLEAFKDSAYALIDASREYRVNAISSGDTRILDINYTQGTNTDKLSVQGKLPDGGNLKMNADGDIAIALWSDSSEVCLVKDYDSNTIQISTTMKTKDSCKL